MRILYIAHTSGAGGSSAALLNILNGMSKKEDVAFAVVCPEAKGYLVDELRNRSIKVYIPKYRYAGYHVYPKVKNPLRWCKAMVGHLWRMNVGKRYIRNAILDFHPDVVHTNSSACVVGWMVCQKMGIKHVWHVREFIDVGFGWTVIPSNQSQRRRMHCVGNYNIAITRAVYNHFNLRSIDTQIYDGVIDTERKVGTKASFGYPYFLFVGNITRTKGVDTLIKQFLNFHHSDNKCHLVIVGPYEGGNKAFYEEVNSMVEHDSASDYVHWLGPRTDVYELMQGAIAIVVPGHNEGFGFITAEAMYNRCLVIGRNTAGTKEQFELGKQETGHEIGLRFSIDAEIPMLMHSAAVGNFTGLKERAREVVLRNYTINVNSDKIHDYYEQILYGSK